MTTAGPKPPNAGKGRVKGVPNKVTASVKGAITQAFDDLGGVDSLVEWGRKNPEAFYPMWGRLAPREIVADVTVKLTDEERAQRLAVLLAKLK